jgi:hypothetical protein
MARPSKYKPEYCEALVKHMKGGLSYESFAGEVGVTRATLYEWEGRHKAFSDAKKLGETSSLLWWEQIGKMAMLGQDLVDKKSGQRLSLKNFNATLWIFNMKNRHGWRDKQEIHAEGFEPLILNMPLKGESITVTKKGSQHVSHSTPATSELPQVPVLPAQPSEKRD